MPDRPDRDPDDESSAPSPEPSSEERPELDFDAEFSRLVADWGPTPELDEPEAPAPAPPARTDDSLKRLLRQAWPEEEPARAADADEHFEPPPPPPIPRPEPRRLLAWLGLFGAPIIGLVLLVSPLPLPSYVGYALFGAFVWGFGYLVWTMGNPRDGWDDGARL